MKSYEIFNLLHYKYINRIKHIEFRWQGYKNNSEFLSTDRPFRIYDSLEFVLTAF